MQTVFWATVCSPCIVCKPVVLLLIFTGYNISEFISQILICSFQLVNVIVWDRQWPSWWIPSLAYSMDAKTSLNLQYLSSVVSSLHCPSQWVPCGPKPARRAFHLQRLCGTGIQGKHQGHSETFINWWMHTGDRMQIDEDEAFVSWFDKYDMLTHNKVDLSYLQFQRPHQGKLHYPQPYVSCLHCPDLRPYRIHSTFQECKSPVEIENMNICWLTLTLGQYRSDNTSHSS